MVLVGGMSALTMSARDQVFDSFDYVEGSSFNYDTVRATDSSFLRAGMILETLDYR